MDIQKAIELLRCAEYNCDNVKKLGVGFADAVKMQIQEAIKLLDGEIVTQDIIARIESEQK